jgi:DNA-binding MarR family transcriptional regulator
MHGEKFEKMVDNLLIYYPLFYRKIKTSWGSVNSKYARADGYYQILGMLISHGNLPISEIGRRLCISKPNMTGLIDKLVKEGHAQRLPDDEDRRIINVEITEEGRKFLYESRRAVEENISGNLSNLDENDIENLQKSLEIIKELVLKINQD